MFSLASLRLNPVAFLKLVRILRRSCLKVSGCWRKLTWALLALLSSGKLSFLLPCIAGQRVFGRLMHSWCYCIALRWSLPSKCSFFKCCHQHWAACCRRTVCGSQLDVSARWLCPFATHPKNRQDAVLSLCHMNNKQYYTYHMFVWLWCSQTPRNTSCKYLMAIMGII